MKNINDFKMACFDGHLSSAIKIYEKWPSVINECGNYIFRVSCERGCLDIVKWLLCVTEGKVNINASNDYAFRFSCQNGHLEIAQYLLSLPSNNININAENDYAFRFSCEFGYIDTAKWLLSLPANNINININNDCIFRNSCSFGHIEIVKWLLSLPNNKIDFDNIDMLGDLNLLINCFGKYSELISFLLSLSKNSETDRILKKISLFRFLGPGLDVTINQDQQILKSLIKLKIITNDSINMDISYKYTNYNKSLLKFIFDNYYHPTNTITHRFHKEYINNEMLTTTILINNQYLIKDLWKIVFDYY